jgi:hypothetical protein
MDWNQPFLSRVTGCDGQRSRDGEDHDAKERFPVHSEHGLSVDRRGEGDSKKYSVCFADGLCCCR